MRNRNKDSYFFKLRYYILMTFLTINILLHLKQKRPRKCVALIKKER